MSPSSGSQGFFALVGAGLPDAARCVVQNFHRQSAADRLHGTGQLLEKCAELWQL
jgi:hypothetical protein